MRLRPLSRAAAAAVLAAAVLPASASATTVSASGGVLTVRDSANVVNRLSLDPHTHETDGVLVLETGGTPLVAGGGCILWDEDILHPRGDMVFCAGQFFQQVVVEAGGGADRVSSHLDSSPVSLRGGTGDDVLRIGVGPGEMRGQGGDDTMSSGEGDQTYIGGPGVDTADYRGHSSDPVDVSLDGSANDGIRDGEHDNVMPSTENVLGSGHGGRLVGNARANRLVGGAGNDLVRGRGGADELLGAGGHDIIGAIDGLADAKIDCGPGHDVALVDPIDPLPARTLATHCEGRLYPGWRG